MNGLNLDRRDAWILAALCHFAGIIPLYGPVFCFLVWLANRRKANALAFQAFQALLVQTAFLFLLLIPLAGLVVVHALTALSAPMADLVAGLNYFITSFLFIGIWVLSLTAGTLVLWSRQFSYPIVGPMIRPNYETPGEMEP